MSGQIPIPIYLRCALKSAERGLRLTLPQLSAVWLDVPTSPDSKSYLEDRDWFRNNSKRRHRLRPSFPDEDRRLTAGILAPLLWVWVIAIDPDHLLRIPVWRGPCPYNMEPYTDSAIAAIVNQCFANKGIDEGEMTAWALRVSAEPPKWQR